MADQAKPTDAEKAQATAQDARAKAIDAQAKADDAGKSPEQRKADAARADADKAAAVAAETETAATPLEPMSAVEAKVMAPHVNEDMSAGDHFAQKFGNDPANPKPVTGDMAEPDRLTVKLTRVTPDLAEPAVTMVAPEMVGDYLRAGWSQG
jgi:hypothetical protein